MQRKETGTMKSRQKNWKWILFPLCLASTLLVCNCTKKVETSNKVKMAIVLPISGQFSRFGDMAKACLQVFQEEVAKTDLLKNYEIEYEWIDDIGGAAQAPVNASLALDQYGCHVALCHFDTVANIASMPLFEEQKIPQLGPISAPAINDIKFKYFAMTTANDYRTVETMVEYIVGVKGYTKIGIINGNDVGGIAAANHIVDVCKEKYGIDVLTHDVLPFMETDFTAPIIKNRDAGVEVLVFWHMGNLQVLVQQIEQMWGRVPEDVVIQGGTNLAQSDIVNMISEEDLSGVQFVSSYIYDPADANIYTFNSRYKELEPQHMDAFDLIARMYDGYWIVAHALNNLGPYDTSLPDFPDKLNTEIHKVEFDGVQGHFNYAAFDNGEGLLKGKVGVWDGYVQKPIYP
jgi:branched-chain amino acid transport system substrate-binding protein